MILQPQPNARTLRQQAFDEGVSQIGQGLAGFANQADQKTQREQALQGEIVKSLVSGGKEVSPENIALLRNAMQVQQPAQGGWLSSIFGGSQNKAPNAFDGTNAVIEQQPVAISNGSAAQQPTQVPAQNISNQQFTSTAPSGISAVLSSSPSVESPGKYALKNTPEKDAELLQKRKQGQLLDLQITAESQKAGDVKNPGQKISREGTSAAYNDIVKQNASILTVKNAIDAAIKQLDDPNISVDAKYKVGENMLKLLNSSVGKDAVGKDEAERLGSNLQYAFGNFTGVGGLRVGRDLDAFITQVKNKSNELADSYELNKQSADSILHGNNGTLKKYGNSPAGKNKHISEPPEKGLIRVSNGVDTFDVSGEDLKAAQKEGFKVIK